MGAPRDSMRLGLRSVAAKGYAQSLLSSRQGCVNSVAEVQAGRKSAEVNSPGGHALAALEDAVPEIDSILVHLQARRVGDASSKEGAKTPLDPGADGGRKAMEGVVRCCNFVPKIIRALTVARAEGVEGAEQRWDLVLFVFQGNLSDVTLTETWVIGA